MVRPESEGGTLNALRLRWRAVRRAFGRLPPTTRGIFWALGAGLSFSLANAAMRLLSQQLHPMQAQFLRYVFGLLPLLPFIVQAGLGGLRPQSFAGQFWRSALHTVGLVLWFIALPHLPLADMTAISFTNPLFVLIGAAWFLKERMTAARWVAVAAGFAGVLIVVGPAMSGQGGWYNLAMLLSAPIFAASFLLTKVLTQRDGIWVIVFWQTFLVTLMSLPIALPFWSTPSALHWALALAGGVLGTVGHYFLTRSFVAADISATQSAKFVDLLWAAALGWLIFDDSLRSSTVLGGAVIVASVVGLARYESGRQRRSRPDSGA
ncbi:MAG: DMT family transporter [Burkholderiaceae bacterium]